jgi:hypothetical protein
MCEVSINDLEPDTTMSTHPHEGQQIGDSCLHSGDVGKMLLFKDRQTKKERCFFPVTIFPLSHLLEFKLNNRRQPSHVVENTCL